MRVIIFSDCHHSRVNCQELFEITPAADKYIFLGDGISSLEYSLQFYPWVQLVAVRGNCDFCCSEKDFDSINLFGKKIVFTHGHLLGVKSGTGTMEGYAKKENAAVMLFGHTHERYNKYHDGIYYFNPGSLSTGSYGLMDISDKGILLSHGKL